MAQAKKISILGVTGSIGQSACDVILSDPARFDVQAVTANTNEDKLNDLAEKLGADTAVLAVRDGDGAIEDAARIPADLILNAIVGVAGLKPLMAAIEQGTCVAIANKEPLVAAGPLVMAAAKQFGTTILPVDSEHNAIFQVFDSKQKDQIERIILTASGGPFLRRSKEDLMAITPEEATDHPNWSMGQKISVDSATMMNKALEVIEAHYLFDMPADKIDVMIHPQSIVHSMVEYSDGSILAQMGASDMRTPIANALSWPERMKTPGDTLDLEKMQNLTFEKPDMNQFPALGWAYDCLERGLYACIALNASNEVAVDAFLQRRIGFLDIMDVIGHSLETAQEVSLTALDDVISYDQKIRAETRDWIESALTKKAKAV